MTARQSTHQTTYAVTGIVLCFFAFFFAAPALAANAAMVLDLRGTVTATLNNEKLPLGIAKQIPAETTLTLGSAAQVILTHYVSKEQATLTGPMVATIDAERIRVVDGASPKTRKVAEDATRLQQEFQGRIVPAAMLMRDLLPKPSVDVPRNGETILDPNIELKVVLPPGTSDVAIELFKGDTKLGDARIGGQSLRLNDLAGKQPLSPGDTYTVSMEGAGINPRGRSTFTLATTAMRNELEALKPTDNGTTDEWVLYAMALEGKRAASAARDVWRKILAERPESAETLNRLAK